MLQPIKTAPQDGTEIYICYNGKYGMQAAWIKKQWRVRRPGNTDDAYSVYREIRGVLPTHWAPVPVLEDELDF